MCAGYREKWIYNTSVPIEYGYYLYLFWLHGKKYCRRFTKIFEGLLLLITFYSAITNTGYNKFFQTYVLITGQAAVIVIFCVYMVELFKYSEEQSLFKNYFYWLASGLLLFNLGDVVFFVLYPVIKKNKWDQFDNIFRLINNNLLILLYLSYIISILVLVKQTKLHARSN